MELVCTKYCLDKDSNPYGIGKRYKYYDSMFVYDALDNKIYDIYEVLDGNDVYMGNGSIQFIKDNFFIKGELLIIKLICKDTCIGANGKKYVKNKTYLYSLKEKPYDKGEPKQYIMYDENRNWLGYVKRKFVRNNFIEWDDYVNEFLMVDELFGSLMESDV